MAQTLALGAMGTPATWWEYGYRTRGSSPNLDLISRIYRCPCFGGLALILRAGKAPLKESG